MDLLHLLFFLLFVQGAQNMQRQQDNMDNSNHLKLNDDKTEALPFFRLFFLLTCHNLSPWLDYSQLTYIPFSDSARNWKNIHIVRDSLPRKTFSRNIEDFINHLLCLFFYVLYTSMSIYLSIYLYLYIYIYLYLYLNPWRNTCTRIRKSAKLLTLNSHASVPFPDSHWWCNQNCR